MKFVRIGKEPFIGKETDRWGVELPTFMVYNDYAGYVEKSFWKDLKEFENHSIADELANVCMQTGWTITGNLDEIRQMLPVTNRLIGRAKGQIWEFNMLTKPIPNHNDWIRSYVILGEPSLKRWTFIDDIKLFFLKRKCAKINRKILS